MNFIISIILLPFTIIKWVVSFLVGSIIRMLLMFGLVGFVILALLYSQDLITFPSLDLLTALLQNYYMATSD